MSKRKDKSELEAFAEVRLREIAAEMERLGRRTLRVPVTAGGVRLSLNANPASEAQKERASREDLPAAFADAQPAMCQVFRLVRKVRDPKQTRDAGTRELWPTDLVALSESEKGFNEMSLTAVNRALKWLRDRELVYVDRAIGYRLGAQQLRLPNLEGHCSTLPDSAA